MGVLHMKMKVWNIQFDPAGLRFTLNTNSDWVSEYFQREYQHLLVDRPGETSMTLIVKETAEEGMSYRCTFPDGSISDTVNLSTVMVWLNRAIKKAFHFEAWWPFHSGAVIDPQGRCVLICGHSGSGKTTLCVYLAQHGWHCLTDDLVWFQKAGKSIRPMPVAFNIREDVVRTSVIAPAISPFWFPDIDGNRRWIYPNCAPSKDEKGLRPSAIILLTFHRSCGAEFWRMPTNESLKAILTNAYSASDMPLNLAMSAGLVKQIPVYQLWYPDCNSGMEKIEKILDSQPTGGGNL